MLYPVLLAAAGLAAYANSFAGVLLLDDHQLLEDLAEYRTVARIVASPRPVVILSLRANYLLGRERVWGYHAFNLSVHLLAGLVLYDFLRRTLRRPGLAFVVALLWVVHPLQTQAVTYISQRGESLMGLFYLLTLDAVAIGAASRPIWYVAAVLCCALGMLTKEVMVTAPLLVLLYDRCFLAPSWRELLRRRWPLYLGLAATWLLLARSFLFAFTTTDPTASAGFALKGITPREYLCSEAGVLVHYLRLAFFPHPLCLDYQWPVARDPVAIVAPGLVVVALLLLTAWALWRHPALGFWGAWFFLILAPTSSFVPIADLAFEHRMYLPLAGVLVLAVLGADAGLQALAQRAGWDETALRGRRIGAVGVVALVCILLTFMRNEDYSSEVAMWRNVLSQYPDNARAHYNLGRALYAAHRELSAEIDHEFQEAIRLRPALPNLRTGYALVLSQEGRQEEADAQLREARRLESER